MIRILLLALLACGCTYTPTKTAPLPEPSREEAKAWHEAKEREDAAKEMKAAGVRKEGNIYYSRPEIMPTLEK